MSRRDGFTLHSGCGITGVEETMLEEVVEGLESVKPDACLRQIREVQE